MLFLIFVSILTQLSAEARTYDFYRPDRRFKGGFCAAIGGACAADNDIVTGIFENPAALATGTADWDFDGDLVTRQSLEGNPKNVTNRGESAGVFGVSYTNGKVGAGLAFAIQKDDVDSLVTVTDDTGATRSLPLTTTARFLQFRAPVGFQITDSLSAGVGLELSRHSQDLSYAGSDAETNGGSSPFMLGVSAGALYTLSPKWRLGSWFRFPTTLNETTSLRTSSVTYSEGLSLHYPWIWATGAQYTLREAEFLFFELDVIGPTRNGYLYSYNTLSAVSNDTVFTPKGRNFALEPHAGFRMPLGKGARLHTGMYFQPSRIEATGGRLHVTAGGSILAFNAIDVIGGVDAAKNALQLIFTFR